MSRASRPWFRSAANAWYATLGGRKVSLGVSGRNNKADAIRAWHKLMSEGRQPKPEPRASVTVERVIDDFLADAEARVSPECLRQYRKHLLPFAQKHGSRLADALTVTDAETYARKPEWSSTYRANFLAALVTAFRCAERSQLLGRNPLIGIRKPPKASRGASALISADEHARLVAHADPIFGAYLKLLWLTGARPGEIAGLRAEDVDHVQGIAILSEHKCSHLGKIRVLFLSAEALAVIRGLGVESGLLFPGEDGQRLTAQAIGCRLRRLCRRAGVRHCIAYGLRHTFATDALSNGVPDAQVAALLGHSGTAMLHRHYSHLTARSQALRQALAQVR
jgi:integrase/recombinase XerC